MTTPPPQPISRVQPLLFAELPEKPSERVYRRRRVSGPRAGSEDAHAAAGNSAAEPAVILQPFFPAPVVEPPPPFDPAALSHAELRALLEALPDAKLAFLLLECAREVKRRASPKELDPEDDAPPAPNPALLRAAAATASELSGEDDAPPAALHYSSGRGGKKAARQPRPEEMFY